MRFKHNGACFFLIFVALAAKSAMSECLTYPLIVNSRDVEFSVVEVAQDDSRVAVGGSCSYDPFCSNN